MAPSPEDAPASPSVERKTAEAQAERLLFGAELGDRGLYERMREELVDRLEEAAATGRPLKVYAGYDPSSPDLHVGHSITLRKLREFQDLGHEVTFLVGTFTAQVGDTSDKGSGRPRLEADRVKEAAATYARQAGVLLDLDKTTVAYNADWLDGLSLADVSELASHFTVQQFLARDSYRRRIDAGNPVGLHEFLYPLLQGYDALQLGADVQLGATEQLFNIMAGRRLQEARGERGLVCITFPILVGTDGVERMSKSQGNYIGLAEPPEVQFGKAMSISDETMVQWLPLVTPWGPDEVARKVEAMRSGQLHPMALKKELAGEIVTMCHGPDAAAAARRAFEDVHQRGQTPTDLHEIAVPAGSTAIDVLVSLPEPTSRSGARRLIDGRGVRVDDRVVVAYDEVLPVDVVLRVGPRRFYRLVAAPDGSA